MLRRSILFRMTRVAAAIIVSPPSATPLILERPRVNGTPTVGVPLSYTTSRLSVTVNPAATRIIVGGTTVASGTASAGYTPAASDVPKNILVEHDYLLADGSTVTAKSYPEVIYSDEWMTPVPVVRDVDVSLTSATQPGTRLLYVANGGAASNRTDVGKFYFWNGSAIIDSAGNTTNPVTSVAYGTDPLNPGAGIVPWGRYAAVAHTFYGQEPGARVQQGGWEYGYGPSQSVAAGRSEYPDWVLFKRGEVFDLSEDLAAYKSELSALGIANTVTLSTLTSRGGLTWGSRQVFGSYGNATTTARAIIKNPPATAFANRFGVWRNVQYFGLVLDVMDTPAGVPTAYGFTAHGTGVGSDNVWFTDVWFSGCASYTTDKAQQHIRVDRCLFSDVHNSVVDVTAIFSGGGTASRMQVKESFFARCGHLMNPRNIEANWASIPAHNPENAYASRALVKVAGRSYFAKRAISAGTAFAYVPGSTWDDASGDWFLCGVDGYAVGSPYSRANYWSGEVNPAETLFTDSISIANASGDQIGRSGARVTRNYFHTGYMGQGGHGGYPDSYGPTGCMEENVLMRQDNGTRGNPGWGLSVGMGAAFVSVRRNIDSSAMLGRDPAYPGFKIEAVNWETSAGYYFHHACRYNVVEGNIFNSGSAVPVRLTDGLGIATPDRHPDYGGGPGILSNQIIGNYFVTTTSADYEYVRTTAAPLTDQTQTYSAGNVRFATPTLCADSLGGADPSRTHVTYLTSLGHTVTSSVGAAEWIMLWENQRRGNWNPALTGKALRNYVAQGWGMATV